MARQETKASRLGWRLDLCAACLGATKELHRLGGGAILQVVEAQGVICSRATKCIFDFGAEMVQKWCNFAATFDRGIRTFAKWRLTADNSDPPSPSFGATGDADGREEARVARASPAGEIPPLCSVCLFAANAFLLSGPSGDYVHTSIWTYRQ